jgi:hypothetical protein
VTAFPVLSAELLVVVERHGSVVVGEDAPWLIVEVNVEVNVNGKRELCRLKSEDVVGSSRLAYVSRRRTKRETVSPSFGGPSKGWA